MTTYVITLPQNMTQLTAKGGSDTYNVNGGSLTIDSDSRYGPNATTTSGPMGNINISATLGGSLSIIGTNVKLLQFSGGSGNVPAASTTITKNGVSAELLCVMSAKTGGSVFAANSVMPTSGWMKVRNISGGNFSAGSITTGIVASVVDTETTGWIEVVGVEALGVSAPRLGQWNINGDWFYAGVTSGSRGQTIQLPFFTDSVLIEYPGVEIETGVGTGIYTFWANAAQMFSSANLSTDSRSMYVYISSLGLVTLGTGLDSLPTGDMPIAGCRVRIPNIILSNCTPANKVINASPNATLGTRYETLTSSAGVLNFSKVTGSWFFNLTQTYSVTLLDVHTCDSTTLIECATQPIVNGLHVGLSNRATQLSVNAIAWSQLYVGGNVSNLSGLRAQAISTSGYVITFTNLYGGWTISKVRGNYAQDATAVSGPIFLNTCDDITLNDPVTVGKRILLVGCKNFNVNRHIYADNVEMVTPATVGSHAIEITSNSKNGKVDGISNWPGVANVHPYNGLIYINTVFDSDFRNIGSAAIPYDCGTINSSGDLVSDGGNNSRCKFHRNWLTNIRTAIIVTNNTSNNITVDNCYNSDASKVHGPQLLNSYMRGNRHNGGTLPTSYVAVYGSHFWDAFTSDTTTRAVIVFTEKTIDATSSASYVVNSGTPKFTSQGALVMGTAGDSITWTWSYFILGWTGFSNTITAGVNLTNHLFEYDLDKGAGFSGVWKTLTQANLVAETGISPTLGYKPKIRISATVTAVTNRLDTFRIEGVTTKALQDAALYPLDYATLNLTSLKDGSTVAVFAGTPSNGQTPIASTSYSGVNASFTYEYNPLVTFYTLRIRKAGYDPLELTYLNGLIVNAPIAQQENKDGFGVAIYGRGTGVSGAFVTVDAVAQRIDIGNTRTIAEDVYNAIALWQATLLGITYPEALRFDGTDLLILGDWRFRRALAAYTSSGIDALPVIDGNPTGSPDDETNGSVDFRARSVRTYQINAAPAITAADMAAAVWNYAQGNGATAESNLRAARTAAENAFAVSV